MLCEICRGSPIPGMVITETGPWPCPNGCIGSIASCCDAAGSAQPQPSDAEEDSVTAEEHLAWAKKRALQYLAGRGDRARAVTSLISDLGNHAETRGVGLAICRDGMAAALSADPQAVRRWIEGISLEGIS